MIIDNKFLQGMLLAALLGFQPYKTQAQVTIGSNTPPVKGALLQLKDDGIYTNDATAKKGLILPRVKLNALTTTDADMKATIEGATGEAWNKAEHTGLIVYHVSGDPYCAEIVDGPYVWSGEEWQPLVDNNVPITLATPVETSQSGNPWGDKIVHHQAKPNPEYNPGTDPNEDKYKYIYQDFYSAKFGNAGRWMVTNLSATNYDGIQHSQFPTRNLEGHNGSSENYFNTAFWTYPKASLTSITPGEAPSAEYTANPYLGLLYTWDAATAGKGGDTGLKNIYNPDGTGEINQESGFADWVGTGLPPVNHQKQIQGICPKGWHLPSDREWTELEQEIIRNTTSYANVAADIDPINGTDNGAIVQQAPGQRGDTEDLSWRGTTHGFAMRNMCENSDGSTGKNLINNGFDALMAGYAVSGKTQEYGKQSDYWSSSSSTYSSNTAWRRVLAISNGKVVRFDNHRYYLSSVRCKKDN